MYGALCAPCALCVVSGGPICKDVGQASPCTRSCLVVAAPPHPSHSTSLLTTRHAHATSTTPIHTGETKDHFVNLCHQDSEKVNGPRKRRTGSHAHRKLGACEVPPPILDRAEASVNLFYNVVPSSLFGHLLLSSLPLLRCTLYARAFVTYSTAFVLLCTYTYVCIYLIGTLVQP